MKKIYHLHIKSTDEHKYYGSLVAVYKHHDRLDLGVSQSKLSRYDFQEPYDNKLVTIRKGFVVSSTRKA